jgi:hypothetical protein
VLSHASVVTTEAARRWDFVPFIPAAAAIAVDVGYLRLIDSQGQEPVPWFVIGLILAAAAALYGAWRDAPQRKAALIASGVILMVLGLLGLWSVGFPLLLAGGAAFYACSLPDRPR